MKKLLASIGIGNAKVDTIIHNHEIIVGGSMSGEVQILGGNVAQEIDKIDLELYTYVEIDDKKYSYSFGKTNIQTQIQVLPNQKLTIPFNLTVPQYTPISAGGYNRVWLNTSLDIDNAIDPTDTDHLNIIPTTSMFCVFEAMEEFGFSLNEVDIERSNIFEWGFVQEFEFRPRSIRTNTKEIEIIFLNENDRLNVFLQKDTKIRGVLGSFFDLSDFASKMYHFAIPQSNANQPTISKEAIKEYIKQYIL